ncbi:hypothetical protein WN943_013345 [Citrus x changshan-huyou]
MLLVMELGLICFKQKMYFDVNLSFFPVSPFDPSFVSHMNIHLLWFPARTMQQSEPQAQPMDTSTAYNIVVPQLVLMQINIMGHRAMLENNKRLWLIICTLENH